MLLLDYARRQVGLPMGTRWLNRHYGWTTDPEKAERMRSAGAIVQEVPSTDKRPEARRFDGYEISFSEGTEVWEGTNGYRP